jgi:hypothetical protein
VEHGLLGALGDAAKAGALDEASCERLRDLAVGALEDPTFLARRTPLVLLLHVRPPPSSLERLWAMAVTPGLPDDDLRRWAAYALAAMKDDGALDARLLADADGALSDGAWPRFERLLEIGQRRALDGMLSAAMRCLEAPDGDTAWLSAARASAYALRGTARLSERWLIAALRDPGAPRFAIAADAAPWHGSPEVRSALEEALGSGAREGRAAAEAAQALVILKAIGVDDPRLGGILDGAPEHERLGLLANLTFFGAPLAPLRRWYVELLVSKDPRVAAEAFEDLYGRDLEGTWELFESVLPLGPLEPARGRIERYLGVPSEAETYWSDCDVEDEDDDEDEEEGDDGDV